MADVLYDFTRIYGIVTAPIHELGHIIFGWISLNPTFPAGWSEVYVLRDELFVSLGGIIGDMLLPVALLYKFRSKKWLYPIVLFNLYSAVDSIGYQGDVFPPYVEIASLIWYLTAVLAVVLITFIAVLTFTDGGRQWEMERARTKSPASDSKKSPKVARTPSTGHSTTGSRDSSPRNPISLSQPRASTLTTARASTSTRSIS